MYGPYLFIPTEDWRLPQTVVGDMSATQKTTHICSTVNVTSDVNYGVIPFTVHFLYESIKTDSICVAHVTIYLSTKKKEKGLQ